jgi:hypothetical protein
MFPRYSLALQHFMREREKKYGRRVYTVKNNGRSERHFIVLLEGSQAWPASPSDWAV